MSDTDRVWELMKKISICMLASWDGQELQARPMAAYVRPDERAVFFLADARHHKENDMKTYSKVCLAFSDTGAQNYVSVGPGRPGQDSRAVGCSSRVVELPG
jgi:general stress protein 26